MNSVSSKENRILMSIIMKWEKVIKLNTVCHYLGVIMMIMGKRVRVLYMCALCARFIHRMNEVAKWSFLYKMRFCKSISPKCVFKQQQTTNTIECWIWGEKKDEKTKRQRLFFGKQTNNTCAVLLNDRTNKRTKQYLWTQPYTFRYTPF